jgi:hypothetical protein
MSKDIKPVREVLSEDVVNLLEEQKEAGYDTVIVIGFKNGEIHTRGSACSDIVSLIGALDLAKLDLWFSTANS